MQKTNCLQLEVQVCFFFFFFFIILSVYTHANIKLCKLLRRQSFFFSLLPSSRPVTCLLLSSSLIFFFASSYQFVGTDDRRDKNHYFVIIYVCRCIVNLHGDRVREQNEERHWLSLENIRHLLRSRLHKVTVLLSLVENVMLSTSSSFYCL